MLEPCAADCHGQDLLWSARPSRPKCCSGGRPTESGVLNLREHRVSVCSTAYS